ncbi:hypothetical protein [Motiliproteus sp.]|uniref:HD domain-containing protein n=1 Tax=Motiliproteus sp. TaxID=1898955 RepID=UPI003BABBE84
MDACRFSQLWMRNLNPDQESDGEVVFDRLKANYSEPCRRYHDGSHIEQCLLWLDRYRHTIDDPDAIELAIWFHDACYGPDPKGHEERGALLLRELAQGRMAPERLEKICTMIALTTHQTPVEDPEQALMLDIDLASFARPWAEYLRDTVRCHEERQLINPVCDYRAQLEFLRELIRRPQLYHHAQFRADHEPAARQNIIQLIELLEARPECQDPPETLAG